MDPGASFFKPLAKRQDNKKVLDLSASGMLQPYQSLVHEEGSSASGFEGFSDLSNTTTSSLIDPSSPSSMIFVGKTRRPAVECTICGDASYGRHYGVVSCEGCKGFFKRTVRREMAYQCREMNNCVVDKRLRNRCHCCRFQKCLQIGMKREAIQGRIRSRESRYSKRGSSGNNRGDGMEVDSSFASSAYFGLHVPHQGASTSQVAIFPMPADGLSEFSLAKLQEADSVLLGPFLTDPKGTQVRVLECGPGKPSQPEIDRQLVENCEKDLYLAIEYIKGCPLIADMPLSDQVALVKCGWNELHLSAMGARAMFANVKHGLILSSGMCISATQASLFGLTGLVERMSQELIAKMTELKVDSFELACLRGIILFNPDAKGLCNADRVEACREKLYSGLEEHCHQMHQGTDVSRFAKLLLRLPSLRSISLKCTDLLFFSQLFPTLPPDGIIWRLLQFPTRDLRSVAAEVHEENLQDRSLMVVADADSGSGSGRATSLVSTVLGIGSSARKGSNSGGEGSKEPGDNRSGGRMKARKLKSPSVPGVLRLTLTNNSHNAVQVVVNAGTRVTLQVLNAVAVESQDISGPERPGREIGVWLGRRDSVTFVCTTSSSAKEDVTVYSSAEVPGAGTSYEYHQYNTFYSDIKPSATTEESLSFDSERALHYLVGETNLLYPGTNNGRSYLNTGSSGRYIEANAAFRAAQHPEQH